MLRLSGEQRSRTARRPPRSLKQEYQEFLLQRIEEYKNALTREELLEIGDEAVRELEESAAGQYLLTEVLLLEHVDRIIARRLRLPSFPRWRQKHRALRAAQRAPTHWGLEPEGPLVSAVRRLEPGDLALVVGAAAAAFAYTAGWFSPDRLTPEKMIEALSRRGGNPLGHRRNHAKGVCFTGEFEANGAGTRLSTAPMLAAGHYPVIGRFAIAVGDPDASDVTGRVRSMAVRIVAPNGERSKAQLGAGKSYFRKAGVEHDVLNETGTEIVFLEVELKP